MRTVPARRRKKYCPRSRTRGGGPRERSHGIRGVSPSFQAFSPSLERSMSACSICFVAHSLLRSVSTLSSSLFCSVPNRRDDSRRGRQECLRHSLLLSDSRKVNGILTLFR